jgi:glycosyltransferase involved in cell wall biosynthesis
LNDRALANELGANARATVLAEFDWRQICRKIERIYDHLVGASSALAPDLTKPVAPAGAER